MGKPKTQTNKPQQPQATEDMRFKFTKYTPGQPPPAPQRRRPAPMPAWRQQQINTLNRLNWVNKPTGLAPAVPDKRPSNVPAHYVQAYPGGAWLKPEVAEQVNTPADKTPNRYIPKLPKWLNFEQSTVKLNSDGTLHITPDAQSKAALDKFKELKAKSTPSTGTGFGIKPMMDRVITTFGGTPAQTDLSPSMPSDLLPDLDESGGFTFNPGELGNDWSIAYETKNGQRYQRIRVNQIAYKPEPPAPAADEAEFQGQQFGMRPGDAETTVRGKLAKYWSGGEYIENGELNTADPSFWAQLSNAAMKALPGAGVGFAVGGPVGALIGGVGSLVGMNALEEEQKKQVEANLKAGYDYAAAIDKWNKSAGGVALNLLDAPRAALERSLGVIDLTLNAIGNKNITSPTTNIDEFARAWRASEYYWDTVNVNPIGLLPEYWGKMNVIGDPGKMFADFDMPEYEGGSAFLSKLMDMERAGATAQDIQAYVSSTTGAPGVAREFISGFLFDPLDKVGSFAKMGVKGYAAQHAPLLLKAIEDLPDSAGLIENFKQYRNLLLTEKVIRPGVEAMDDFTRLERMALGDDFLKFAMTGEYTQPKPWQLWKQNSKSAAISMINDADTFLQTRVMNEAKTPEEAIGLLNAFKTGDFSAIPTAGDDLLNARNTLVGRFVQRTLDTDGPQALLEKWQANAPARDALGELERGLGAADQKQSAKLVQSVAENEANAQQALDGYKAATGNDLTIDGAPATAASLASTAKLFADDSTMPRNAAHFKSLLYVDTMTDFGKKFVQTTGIKPPRLIFRMAAATKAMSSVLLLAPNPQYLVNNFTNGFLMMGLDGVFGLQKISEIMNRFDRLGIDPVRLRAGVGQADLGDLSDISAAKAIKTARGLFEEADSRGFGEAGAAAAMGEVRKAAQVDGGVLSDIQSIASKISGSPFSVTKYAQELERFQSANAVYRGFMQLWSRTWREGAAIPRMPRELEAALADIDADLPDAIRSVVRSGYNMDEITSKIFTTREIGRTAEAYADRVADALGMTRQETDDLLRAVGVIEIVNDELGKLKKKAGPGDIRKVFEEQVTARVEKHITEAQQREMDVYMQRVRDVYGAGQGDTGEVVRMIGNVMADMHEVMIEHINLLDDEHEEINSITSAALRDYKIQQSMARGDRQWRDYFDKQAAVLGTLGEEMRKSGLDDKGYFSQHVATINTRWADFFEYRKQAIKAFYDKADRTHEDWLAVLDDLQARYDVARRDVTALQTRADNLFAAEFSRAYGKESGARFSQLAKMQRDFLDDDRKQMSDFRAAMRNVRSRKDKHTAWRRFNDGIFDESGNLVTEGRLQRWQKHEAEIAAYITDLNKDLPMKAGATETARKAQTATTSQTTRKTRGIDTTTPNGALLAEAVQAGFNKSDARGAERHALNAVNVGRSADTKYKTLADVPEAELRAALEARIARDETPAPSPQPSPIGEGERLSTAETAPVVYGARGMAGEAPTKRGVAGLELRRAELTGAVGDVPAVPERLIELAERETWAGNVRAELVGETAAETRGNVATLAGEVIAAKAELDDAREALGEALPSEVVVYGARGVAGEAPMKRGVAGLEPRRVPETIRPMDRAQFETRIMGQFTGDVEQRAALMTAADFHARRWSDTTGRSVEEWYGLWADRLSEETNVMPDMSVTELQQAADDMPNNAERIAVRVEEDWFDSYRGEMFGALLAYDDGGRLVGRVRLSSIGDQYNIQYIEVAPDLKRRGIGSQMYAKLKDMAGGGKNIEWGSTTPEGTGFKNALRRAGELYQIDTRNEAFKNWFGDSKVVDADGAPLVVYHGTPSKGEFSNNRYVQAEQGNVEYKEFNTFKTDAQGVTDSGWLGRGSYFTPDPDYANDYGDRIYPVYLSIKNPFTLVDDRSNSQQNIYRFLASIQDLPGLPEKARIDTKLPDPWIDEDYRGWKWRKSFDLVEANGNPPESRYLIVDNVQGISKENENVNFSGAVVSKGSTPEMAIAIANDKRNNNEHRGFILHVISREIGSEEFTKSLKAAGYDGLIEYADIGAPRMSEVVAFEPTQIKSVFNRGTFDPNDPNILYQRTAQKPTALVDQFGMFGADEGGAPTQFSLFDVGAGDAVARPLADLPKPQIGATVDGVDWAVGDQVVTPNGQIGTAVAVNGERTTVKVGGKQKTFANADLAFGARPLFQSDIRTGWPTDAERAEAMAEAMPRLREMGVRTEADYRAWQAANPEQAAQIEAAARRGIALYQTPSPLTPLPTGEGAAKGMFKLMSDGRRYVRAGTGADISTAIHEVFGHGFLYDLFDMAQHDAGSAADLKTVVDWNNRAGLDVDYADFGFEARTADLPAGWAAEERGGLTEVYDERGARLYAGADRDAAIRRAKEIGAHEMFARGMERFMTDGYAPTPELRNVFARFRKWLVSVYRQIIGSPIGREIPADVRAVYERLFVQSEPAAPLTDAPHRLMVDQFVRASDLDQRLRAQYVQAGAVVADSNTTPSGLVAETGLRPGQWAVDDLARPGEYGTEISQARLLDPDTLEPVEDLVLTNTDGRGDDAARYQQWLSEGRQAPPVQVMETDDGRYTVIDGHRRYYAAKAAKYPILALVQPKMEIGKTKDGSPLYARLTREAAMLLAYKRGDVGAEAVKDIIDAVNAGEMYGLRYQFPDLFARADVSDANLDGATVRIAGIEELATPIKVVDAKRVRVRLESGQEMTAPRSAIEAVAHTPAEVERIRTPRAVVETTESLPVEEVRPAYAVDTRIAESTDQTAPTYTPVVENVPAPEPAPVVARELVVNAKANDVGEVVRREGDTVFVKWSKSPTKEYKATGTRAATLADLEAISAQQMGEARRRVVGEWLGEKRQEAGAPVDEAQTVTTEPVSVETAPVAEATARPWQDRSDMGWYRNANDENVYTSEVDASLGGMRKLDDVDAYLSEIEKRTGDATDEDKTRLLSRTFATADNEAAQLKAVNQQTVTPAAVTEARPLMTVAGVDGQQVPIYGATQNSIQIGYEGGIQWISRDEFKSVIGKQNPNLPDRVMAVIDLDRQIDQRLERFNETGDDGWQRAAAALIDERNKAAREAAGKNGQVTLRDPIEVKRPTPPEGGYQGSVTFIEAPNDPTVRYEAVWVLRELDSLVSHHDTAGNVNPAYPTDLMTEAQNAPANMVTAYDMARNLKPDMLLDGRPGLGDGSPIVGSDGVVESGNTRTLVLRTAVDQFPHVYEGYRESLRDAAGKFGFSADEVDGFRNPVLVREIVQDVDRPALARLANEPVTGAVDAARRASSDARLVPDTALIVPDGLTLAQALRQPYLADFVSAFLDAVPEQERGALLMDDGELSAAGVRRIGGAMLARSMSGDAGLRLAWLLNATDDVMTRNVINGVLGALPEMARVEARSGLAIANDLSTALAHFAELESGALTPLAERMLADFSDMGHSARRTREVLANYERLAGAESGETVYGRRAELWAEALLAEPEPSVVVVEEMQPSPRPSPIGEGVSPRRVELADSAPGDVLKDGTVVVKRGLRLKREAQLLADESGGVVLRDGTKWAVAREPEQLMKHEMPEAVAQALDDWARLALSNVKDGAAGKRIRTEAGDYIAQASTYPEFYQTLSERYNVSKAAVESALNKIITDNGADTGLTVERLKELALVEIANGFVDPLAGPVPGVPEAAALIGKVQDAGSKIQPSPQPSPIGEGAGPRERWNALEIEERRTLAKTIYGDRAASRIALSKWDDLSGDGERNSMAEAMTPKPEPAKQTETAPAASQPTNLLDMLAKSNSENVQAAYNGKVVDMGYAAARDGKVLTKKQEREQFNRAAMRINDNLGTGGFTDTAGYIKTPDGKYYQVDRGSKMAKLIDAPTKTAEASAVPVAQAIEVGSRVILPENPDEFASVERIYQPGEVAGTASDEAQATIRYDAGTKRTVSLSRLVGVADKKATGTPEELTRGTRVQYTNRKGETLTGRVEYAMDDTVSVQVEQIKEINVRGGRIPIGRVETWPREKLTVIEKSKIELDTAAVKAADEAAVIDVPDPVVEPAARVTPETGVTEEVQPADATPEPISRDTEEPELAAAPPETAPAADINSGAPEWSVDDRAVTADGIHGRVVSVVPMVSHSIRGGRYDVVDQYTLLDVELDTGRRVTVNASRSGEVARETGAAPVVARWPEFEGTVMEPSDLESIIQMRLNREKEYRNSARLRRDRTKKADDIKKADMRAAEAANARAILEKWYADNPTDAIKYRKPVDVAVAEVQVNAASGKTGVRMQFNTKLDGVELIFDERPSADTLAEVRASGFKWSAREKLWYAKHSDRTVSAAKRIAGIEEAARTQAVETVTPGVETATPVTAAIAPAEPLDTAAAVRDVTRPNPVRESDLKDAAKFYEGSRPNVMVSSNTGWIDTHNTYTRAMLEATTPLERAHFAGYRAMLTGGGTAFGNALMWLRDKEGFTIDDALRNEVKAVIDDNPFGVWRKADRAVTTEPTADVTLPAEIVGETSSTPAASGAILSMEAQDDGVLREPAGRLETGSQETAPQLGAGDAGDVVLSPARRGGADAARRDAGADLEPAGSAERGDVPGPDRERTQQPRASAGSGEGGLAAARPRTSPAVEPRTPTEALDELAAPLPSQAPQTFTSVKGGNNYRITAADEIGRGGKKTKYRNNVAAIRLLKQLEAEGRLATPDEQAVLVKYTGWGGLKELFDDKHAEPTYRVYEENAYGRWGYVEKKSDWHEEYTELKALLTEEEYDAANMSKLNAHYTSFDVVREMWGMVEQLGFKGGRVLEPAGGSGNFIGLMPPAIFNASRTTAIEMDHLTGRLLSQLYQGVGVHVSPYQKVPLPNDYFDLTISNIPFGRLNIADRDFLNRPGFLRKRIHNYYFAKALDQTRPGGLIMFITSAFTMDAPTSQPIRQWLHDNGADFVGAIRLPQDAFEKNAGTSVLTDIIVLRKRAPGETPTEMKWFGVKDFAAENGKTYQINEYFADHPDMMIGTPTDNEMYTPKKSYEVDALDAEGKAADAVARFGLRLDNPDNLPRLLNEAGRKLPADLYQPVTHAVEREGAIIGAGGREKYKTDGVYLTDDGRLATYDGRTLQDYAAPDDLTPTEVKDWRTRESRYRDFIAVRDAYDGLISRLREGQDEAGLEAGRKAVDTAYDAFVAKHGRFNDRENRRLFSDDPDLPILLSLEKVNETTGEITKEPILVKVTPQTPPESAGTALDALVISMQQRGKVDLNYMRALTGKADTELLADLGDRMYQDPNAGWVTSEEYLSGNVRQKLKAAEALAESDPAYARNVEALKAVVPEWMPKTRIFPQLGASWLEPGDIGDFLAHLVGSKTADTEEWVRFQQEANLWTLDVPDALKRDPKMTTVWGTPDRTGLDLINNRLNSRPIRVEKEVETIRPDGSTGKKRVLDDGATMAANAMADKLQAEFETWLWSDAQRAARYETKYNEIYHSWAQRNYRGREIYPTGYLPGMNASLPPMRDAQLDAIWRGVQENNLGLFHDVGAGKTRIMIAIGMEQRRMGLRHKVVYDVPNASYTDFVKQFKELYPTANILTLSPRDMGDETRRATTMARIASGNYDAIVVPHSTMTMIPVTDKTFNAYLAERVAALKVVLDDLKARREEEQRSNRSSYGRRKQKDEGSRATEQEIRRIEKLMQGYLEDARGLDEATAAKQAVEIGDVVRKPKRGGGGRQQKDNSQERINNRIAKLQQQQYQLQARQDMGLTWEDLGIDQLFVDEAHKFKNLSIESSRTDVRGMGKVNADDAQRAQDLYMKLREVNKRGGGVVFATGTPVSNSGVEMYTMMKYLHPERLRAMGVYHADAWINQFAQIFSVLEPNATSTAYKDVSRFRLFRNGRALLSLLREFADIQTADMLELPRPKAKYIDAVIKMSPEQIRLREVLAERQKKLKRPKPGEKPEDTWFSIMSDGRKMAVDMRLYDPRAKDRPDSKINTVVKNVLDAHKRTADYKGTQLVFLTEGVHTSPNLYTDVKKKLIAGGIPANEIAFIQDFPLGGGTEQAVKKAAAKRQQLFDDVNEGKVRVVFGTYEGLGTGVNVQRRLFAVHEVTVPFKPSEIEQGEGRILRPGNMHYANGQEVEIYRYSTENSNDSFMWNLVNVKAQQKAQVFSGKADLDTFDTPDAGSGFDSSLMSSYNDPLAIEWLDVSKKFMQADMARKEHQRRKIEYSADLKDRRLYLRSWEQASDNAALVLAHAQQNRPAKFAGTVGDRTYTKVGEFGDAVYKAMTDRDATLEYVDTGKSYKVGEVNGFEVYARASTRLHLNKDEVKKLKLPGDAYLGVVNYSLTMRGGGGVHLAIDNRPVAESFGDLLTPDAIGRALNKNLIDEYTAVLKDASEKLAEHREYIDTLQAEVVKPFDGEEAYLKLLSRKSELDKYMEEAQARNDATAREAGGVEMEDTGAGAADDETLYQMQDRPTVAIGGRRFEIDVTADADGTPTRRLAYRGTVVDGLPDVAPEELRAHFETNADLYTEMADRIDAALSAGADARAQKVKKTDQRNGPMLYQRSAQTDTPEFKRWFGDSKVVDKNGRPIVVYHGTRAEFSAFDTEKLGSATPAKTSVLGFFFTDNENVSNLFNRGEGGRSIPAFLSIKNPLEIGATDVSDRKRMSIDPFEAVHNAITKISGKESWDAVTNDDVVAWREKVKSIGYDGIIVRYTAMDSRGGGTARSIYNPYHDFYIAFEPTQIKSATGNRGTFDPSDPNILYQMPDGTPANAVGHPAEAGALTGEIVALPNGESAAVTGATDETLTATRDDGRTIDAPIDPGVYPTPPQATADSRPVPLPDALSQLWTSKVRGMVDEMKELMATDAAQPATRGLGGREIDPNTLAMLDKYLGQVSGSMGKAKQQAMRWGEIKRDAALLNYSDRRQYNDYLSLIAPYEFFMTRSMAAWALRAIDHPSIIANYLRTKRLMETAVTSKGTPTRLQGQARIPAPFLPDWMGDSIYFDPMRIGLPLQSFTDPWTTWGENQVKIDDRAAKTIDQWVADETIVADDAAQALRDKSGAVWDKAVAYVKSQDKSLDKDALDLGMSIVSPHLPLKWALDSLRGKQDQTSQLPITRYVRALSIAAGVGGSSGINLEEGFRKANGLPVLDQWADYRIDRELANMAADGALKPDGTPVTVDDVKEAMISREGVVYEMATIREAQQAMIKSAPLGQIFKTPLEQVPEAALTMALVTMFGQGVNVLPEGETQQRALSEKYQLFKAAYSAEMNGNKSAMTSFLADHPEYEARLSLYDDKEERLRSFLVGKVWDKWANIPRAYKQDLQQAFGQEFGASFLEKTTRNYEEIPLETLTRWANTLGVLVPGDPKSNPLPVQWTDPATARAVETYYSERETLFDWPAVSAQLGEYYEIDPNARVSYQSGVYKSGKKKGQPIIKSVSQKNIYMDKHPELGTYFDWSAAYKKENPGVQAYLDEAKTLYSDSPYSESQWQQLGYTLPQELSPIAMAWVFSGRQPNASSKKALTAVWEKNGKPNGTLENWLMQELALQ